MSVSTPSGLREGPSHLPGVTRLAYSKDGTTIYTGGSDCMLRYHNVHNPDSEPGFFDEHREPITALATTKGNLITGCEDGVTRSFGFPANEFEGNVSRASGVSVRWLAVNYTGEKVAVCSDDLLVKVIHIKDPLRITLLPGLTRPVRSATWHTKQDIIAIVMTDGKIQIFEVSEGNASCLKTIEAIVAAGKPDDDLPCAVAWHPKGEFFVVPTRSHDIAIIDSQTWTRTGNFSASGHDGEIGLLAWSPNGQYLVSSGKDNQIIIWETEGRRPVSRIKVTGGIVTGLEFSPTDNAISWTCLDGTFSTWQDPIPAELAHPARLPRVHATRQQGLEGELVDGIEADEDDLMGEDLEMEDNDDWIVDDNDGAIYKERAVTPNGEGGMREVVALAKAQPSFQPGSTTLRGKKRYLAFNMIGVVDVTDQDTHHVVNVEFHDKGADRRGYHFQDHNRFSLAAIGEQGIVYGSRADGDLPALIQYKAYDTWASGADWQVSLPADEQPVLLASGGKSNTNEFEVEDASVGSVVVATTRGYIRFFTGSGIQRYIWRMGEEVVSMVAGKEMVFLVHREGGTSLDGCQNLRYTLIDLDSFDTVQEGRVPLPRKTTLAWIGFSQSGAPAMYDSDGLLSILDRCKRRGQARWSPLLDTRSLIKKEGGNQTAYWPVGLSDSQLMCVILKGMEREPYFPRPVILDVNVAIPLLNMDIAQGQSEEKLLRDELQLDLLRDTAAGNEESDAAYEVNKLEVSQDKELLKLVQAACKADKLQRALDIVRIMNNPKTIEAAGKVAAFYHLPGLQEKIGIIREATEDKKRRKERAGRNESYRMVARETPVPSYASPVPSRAALAAAKVTEFAPRSLGSKRASRAQVASTTYEDLSPSISRYVSETPEPMNGLPSRREEDDLLASPESKRRRLDNQTEDDGFRKPYPPTESMQSDTIKKPSGIKNPFARKIPASNPFAKANVTSNTQAKKSYSFFDKVEDAENAAKVAAEKNGKGKEVAKKIAKQTTLSMAPKRPVTKPSLQSENSLASTVVDDLPAMEDGMVVEDDLEETQTDAREIQASPEAITPAEEAPDGDDDAEPLEWEDSDNEEATAAPPN